MVNRMSNSIARYLAKKKVIEEVDIPIYAFGFEALFASVFGTILLLTIGYLLNQGIHTIIFIVIFALTRSFSGGYHAHSHLTCNLAVALVYLFTIVLADAIVYSNMMYTIVIFVLFYLSVILRFAPVPNIHKQVSAAESKGFREKVLILSAIWTIAAIVFYFLNVRIAITIAVTLFFIAVLIIIQQYINREGGATL